MAETHRQEQRRKGRTVKIRHGWTQFHEFAREGLKLPNSMLWMFGIGRLWIVWDSKRPVQNVIRTKGKTNG